MLHVNEEMWAAMRLPPSLYPNIGLAIKLMNGWKDGAAGSRMAQESARLSLPLRRHHDYLRCPRTSVSTFDSVLGRDPETHTSPCPNATVSVYDCVRIPYSFAAGKSVDDRAKAATATNPAKAAPKVEPTCEPVRAWMNAWSLSISNY